MAKMPENRYPAKNNCKSATYIREDFGADEARLPSLIWFQYPP